MGPLGAAALLLLLLGSTSAAPQPASAPVNAAGTSLLLRQLEDTTVSQHQRDMLAKLGIGSNVTKPKAEEKTPALSPRSSPGAGGTELPSSASGPSPFVFKPAPNLATTISPPGFTGPNRPVPFTNQGGQFHSQGIRPHNNGPHFPNQQRPLPSTAPQKFPITYPQYPKLSQHSLLRDQPQYFQPSPRPLSGPTVGPVPQTFLGLGASLPSSSLSVQPVSSVEGRSVEGRSLPEEDTITRERRANWQPGHPFQGVPLEGTYLDPARTQTTTERNPGYRRQRQRQYRPTNQLNRPQEEQLNEYKEDDVQGDGYSEPKRGQRDQYSDTERRQGDGYSDTERSQGDGYSDTERVQRDPYSGTGRRQRDPYSGTERDQGDRYSDTERVQRDPYSGTRRRQRNRYSNTKRRQGDGYSEPEDVRGPYSNSHRDSYSRLRVEPITDSSEFFSQEERDGEGGGHRHALGENHGYPKDHAARHVYGDGHRAGDPYNIRPTDEQVEKEHAREQEHDHYYSRQQYDEDAEEEEDDKKKQRGSPKRRHRHRAYGRERDDTEPQYRRGRYGPQQDTEKDYYAAEENERGRTNGRYQRRQRQQSPHPEADYDYPADYPADYNDEPATDYYDDYPADYPQTEEARVSLPDDRRQYPAIDRPSTASASPEIYPASRRRSVGGIRYADETRGSAAGDRQDRKYWEASPAAGDGQREPVRRRRTKAVPAQLLRQLLEPEQATSSQNLDQALKTVRKRREVTEAIPESLDKPETEPVANVDSSTVAEVPEAASEDTAVQVKDGDAKLPEKSSADLGASGQENEKSGEDVLDHDPEAIEGASSAADPDNISRTTGFTEQMFFADPRYAPEADGDDEFMPVWWESLKSRVPRRGLNSVSDAGISKKSELNLDEDFKKPLQRQQRHVAPVSGVQTAQASIKEPKQREAPDSFVEIRPVQTNKLHSEYPRPGDRRHPQQLSDSPADDATGPGGYRETLGSRRPGGMPNVGNGDQERYRDDDQQRYDSPDGPRRDQDEDTRGRYPSDDRRPAPRPNYDVITPNQLSSDVTSYEKPQRYYRPEEDRTNEQYQQEDNRDGYRPVEEDRRNYDYQPQPQHGHGDEGRRYEDGRYPSNDKRRYPEDERRYPTSNDANVGYQSKDPSPPAQGNVDYDYYDDKPAASPDYHGSDRRPSENPSYQGDDRKQSGNGYYDDRRRPVENTRHYDNERPDDRRPPVYDSDRRPSEDARRPSGENDKYDERRPSDHTGSTNSGYNDYNRRPSEDSRYHEAERKPVDNTDYRGDDRRPSGNNDYRDYNRRPAEDSGYQGDERRPSEGYQDERRPSEDSAPHDEDRRPSEDDGGRRHLHAEPEERPQYYREPDTRYPNSAEDNGEGGYYRTPHPEEVEQQRLYRQPEDSGRYQSNDGRDGGEEAPQEEAPQEDGQQSNTQETEEDLYSGPNQGYYDNGAPGYYSDDGPDFTRNGGDPGYAPTRDDGPSYNRNQDDGRRYNNEDRRYNNEDSKGAETYRAAPPPPVRAEAPEPDQSEADKQVSSFIRQMFKEYDPFRRSEQKV